MILYSKGGKSELYYIVYKWTGKNFNSYVIILRLIKKLQLYNQHDFIDILLLIQVS